MMRGGVCFPRLKKGGFLMKLNHPAKRLTAALLSGAMLFTLRAPALAADPGTAAAAQWCVEQGYLDAKKDGKFDPDGWTPKFRVIEVWNKAFPKQ